MRFPIALSGAAAALTLGSLAYAQTAPMVAWPALVASGKQYAVEVDESGKIVQCTPLIAATPPEESIAACIKLQTRGIPAEAQPARTANDPAAWLTPADYPAEALRGHQGGTTQALLVIGKDGKLDDCIVRASSGSGDIDKAVCATVKKRARFTPATYKGQPVLAVRFSKFSVPTP